ncbi:Uncharacterised protein [Yersinia pseudotuberculosis]|uniref:hypothetical protein n=1 Tax=Yersinia pseudotuberculosis TaxID=633 RepID=UPI0005E1846F|nr:hypothetical protein [Yersinia pseudotuberculosis]CNL43217.1 Uncharacterised protein [Yersinia pseudotuberculosis]
MSSFKTLGFFFLSLSLLFSSLLVLLSLLLFAGLLLFPSLLPFSRFLPFAGFSPASGFSLATKYDEGFSGNVSYRGDLNDSPKTDPLWIPLPALPLIQQAVTELVPTVQGQYQERVMSQVCALARGERTQEQVAQTLRSYDIDISNIPPQGHPLSLLVSTDQSSRVIGCAAYIASSVMAIPKSDEFMVSTDKPADALPGKKNEAASKEKTLSIDPKKLAQYLQTQLAVAKANADIFAIIAVELEKKPGLTVNEYSVQIKKVFSEVASAYLQRVKALYAVGAGVNYKLITYSDEGFKFISNDGYLFEYGYDSLSLYFNRIPWYGSGKILGKEYFFSVSYIEPNLVKRIREEKREEKSEGVLNQESGVAP